MYHDGMNIILMQHGSPGEVRDKSSGQSGYLLLCMERENAALGEGGCPLREEPKLELTPTRLGSGAISSTALPGGIALRTRTLHRLNPRSNTFAPFPLHETNRAR